MAATILAAMEHVLRRKLTAYSRYGSPGHKQVYIYGGLDPGPRIIEGDLGVDLGRWRLARDLFSGQAFSTKPQDFGRGSRGS